MGSELARLFLAWGLGTAAQPALHQDALRALGVSHEPLARLSWCGCMWAGCMSAWKACCSL